MENIRGNAAWQLENIVFSTLCSTSGSPERPAASRLTQRQSRAMSANRGIVTSIARAYASAPSNAPSTPYSKSRKAISLARRQR
jgi:hypothetical protein